MDVVAKGHVFRRFTDPQESLLPLGVGCVARVQPMPSPPLNRQLHLATCLQVSHTPSPQSFLLPAQTLKVGMGLAGPRSFSLCLEGGVVSSSGLFTFIPSPMDMGLGM